ncbi:hypothetical protein [Vagococcus fluvialis]|jgi:hypothetical protein|uniref:hypothetical protein n=1 Tax=Vagococcus fluvialis TaxID=2738 RepID=UPI001432F9A8|nr:hypothetical protein [Vagococcus fluvialis]MDR2278709.1 hypothetical protein [Vagococcus sp.]MBO0444152.1 hypothetical protein [Vagococcus fluvialis]MBO0488327.1 hypothetical protein [Vagococcus fluvialis]MCM2140180.1 hypothetical protein [Vagococcus fluvialis]MDT2748110.1 hypothetical protein [Vagococcus fluvialis]
MSKIMIVIGSIIDYPTVHEEQVVVRDYDEDTYIVLKSTIEEDGYSVDDKNYVHKTRFTRS